MAKDIKLLIKGSAEKAEAAIRELQRTGHQSTSLLERDFKQLGVTSSMMFDNQRAAAQVAYEKIKSSGLATTDELQRAQKAYAAKLVEIDQDQYGKRASFVERYKVKTIAAYAAIGTAAAAYAAKRVASAGLDAFEDYESALVDMGKVTDENLGAIDKRIMAMPEELGSATSLMRGYYQTLSAGVTDQARAQELLTTAAKGSKAAHVDQSDTIRALTKLMAGFSGEIDNATQASDLLFAMERYGQTTFQELVPVIGDIAALSHQAGIGQYEMAAMMSRLTQTAGSTSQAATQYRAIVMGLLKPQQNMRDALQELGFESGQAAIEQLGLSGALKEVKDYALDSGLQLSQLFESSEALTGLGPQLADEFDQYNQTQKDVERSAGGTEEAFNRWRQSSERTSEVFDNTINKVLIELGRTLTPEVNRQMDRFSNWVTSHRGEITSFFEGLGGVLQGVANFAGSVYDGIGRITEAIASLSMTIENSAIYQFIGSGVSQIRSYDWLTAGFNTATNMKDGGGLDLSGSGLMDNSGYGLSGSGPSTKFDSGYAVGTRYVPRTGYYQLHRGESVSTRSETGSRQAQAPSVSIGNLSFNLPNVTNQSSARDLARDVAPELLRLFRDRYRMSPAS